MSTKTTELEGLCLPFRTPTQPAGEKLRIGIVAPASGIERWMGSLWEYLRAIPGFEAFLIPLPVPETPRQPDWLTERLYAASRRRSDPFGPLDSIAEQTRLDDAAVAPSNCDIVIWLARGRDPSVKCEELARYAVLSVQLGEQRWDPPYWSESAAGKPTSKVTVYWHESRLTRGRALRSAEVASQLGLYFTENARNPLLACERLVASLCVDVRQQGDQWRSHAARVALPEEELSGKPGPPPPWESARFAVSKLMRSALGRWKARGKNPAWFIAMRRNRGSTLLEPQGRLDGFQPLQPPKGTAVMADPFLVEEGGRTWMLIEEIPEGRSTGRLCSAELTDDGRISEWNVVLDTRSHLSYPCTVRDRGELFMIPESSAARRLDLFHLGKAPYRAELASTLLDGMSVVDTTPFQLDNRWYFFTTTSGAFMETLLFWSDRLDGPLKLHPASPVSTSVRNARSAGHLFYSGGKLYRPAQDCSIRYGYGITLNEVTRLTPAEFEERPVRTIAPDWLPGLIATHTWNESSRYQVIDGFMDLG